MNWMTENGKERRKYVSAENEKQACRAGTTALSWEGDGKKTKEVVEKIGERRLLGKCGSSVPDEVPADKDKHNINASIP